MKINASLLTRSMTEAPVSEFGTKLAARIEPGQTFELVNGKKGRILQKSASSEGVRLHASLDGKTVVLSAASFAEMGPVSPAMHRLASFVHSILAYDANVDTYVKTAIREAGLPVDNGVNWSKYLAKRYRNLVRNISTDPEVFSDAVLGMITHELYEKKLLSPDSPFAHFDPNNEKNPGTDLATKVTAYLYFLFKSRAGDVETLAKRIVGIGAGGAVGLIPAESTDALPSDAEGEGQIESSSWIPTHENEALLERESLADIHAFLKAFAKDVLQHQRKATRPALFAITREYIKGADSTDIRERVTNDPQLLKEEGKPVTRHNYNYAANLWARLIKVYAQDPKNPWSRTSIAKLIATRAQIMEKETAKALTSTASLHLADVLENGQPVANPQTMPNQAPPPPINPNVKQQNAVRQNGLNMAQPANDADPNNEELPAQPNAQKKTIPQEIPGVNHTASTETTMSTPAKKKTPVLARVAPEPKKAAKVNVVAPVKYAALRQIARNEPGELGAALTQLHTSFLNLAGKLAAVQQNLDLTIPTPKSGSSVREKIAYRTRYAAGLRRVAEESPEQVNEVVNDLYSGLDELVTEIENLADHLDIQLVDPSSEDAELPELPGEEEGPFPEDDSFDEETSDEMEPAVA